METKTLIMGSNEQLEIGKITPPCHYFHINEWHDNVRFFVIREATREEYFKFCEQMNCLDKVKFDQMAEYYYEVHTD